MDRDLILRSTVAVAAAAFFLFQGRAAHAADQFTIDCIKGCSPGTFPESYRKGLLSKFEVTNDGIDVNINSVTGNRTGLLGDVTRDQITKPSPFSRCNPDVPFVHGATCTVTLAYNILDSDTGDENKPDTALWGVSIRIDYSPVSGGPPQHQFGPLALLTVKDDRVPEPSAWWLMTMGSGALGAALRGRRRAGAA
jgi:hypothetical protein